MIMYNRLWNTINYRLPGLFLLEVFVAAESILSPFKDNMGKLLTTEEKKRLENEQETRNRLAGTDTEQNGTDTDLKRTGQNNNNKNSALHVRLRG